MTTSRNELTDCILFIAEIKANGINAILQHLRWCLRASPLTARSFLRICTYEVPRHQYVRMLLCKNSTRILPKTGFCCWQNVHIPTKKRGLRFRINGTHHRFDGSSHVWSAPIDAPRCPQISKILYRLYAFYERTQNKCLQWHLLVSQMMLEGRGWGPIFTSDLTFEG